MSPSGDVRSRLLRLSTAAVLAMQAASASPARAQASPACFKVCSSIFYKHVSALMKCAAKEVDDLAVTAACGTKAATKMHEKYVVKLQNKCGGAACVTAYPETRDVGCEKLVFSAADAAATVFFASSAVPQDVTVFDRIVSAGVPGCGY